VKHQNSLEPNVRQAVPFLAVADIQQSLRFYVDGLGFCLADQWVVEGELRWCWLELGSASLMLQELRPEQHGLSTAHSKFGAGVTIYFICRDSLEIYREITSRGINAKRPFVGNGMWVTSLADPDGYNLCFESRTNDTEGTELQPDAPGKSQTE